METYTLSYDNDGYLTRIATQHSGSDYIHYRDLVYAPAGDS